MYLILLFFTLNYYYLTRTDELAPYSDKTDISISQAICLRSVTTRYLFSTVHLAITFLLYMIYDSITY